MPNIEIYTTNYCPYCTKAKTLLTSLGLEFTEIDVTNDPDMRQTMTTRSGGGRTVPQIFINDKAIGGCDDLYELHETKKLEPLLH